MLREFTSAEIKQALDQMNAGKASSFDGMTSCFYRKYWSIVGQDITRVILGFFNGNEQLEAINHTNLVMIPKKNHLAHQRTSVLLAYVMSFIS